MNSNNETIVSGEMHDELKRAGLAADYVPVPKQLQERARRLLGSRGIVSMDRKFRKKVRQLESQVRQLKGNLRHESALRRGVESPIVKAQLEAVKTK